MAIYNDTTLYLSGSTSPPFSTNIGTGITLLSSTDTSSIIGATISSVLSSQLTGIVDNFFVKCEPGFMHLRVDRAYHNKVLYGINNITQIGSSSAWIILSGGNTQGLGSATLAFGNYTVITDNFFRKRLLGYI